MFSAASTQSNSHQHPTGDSRHTRSATSTSNGADARRRGTKARTWVEGGTGSRLRPLKYVGDGKVNHAHQFRHAGAAGDVGLRRLARIHVALRPRQRSGHRLLSGTLESLTDLTLFCRRPIVRHREHAGRVGERAGRIGGADRLRTAVQRNLQ